MGARRRAQRGFTLLEAIVAMVLVSGFGLALFGWINTNIATLARVQEANARAEATTNALEYLYRVNPMLEPEGQADLGGYSIRWQASPATGVVNGMGFPRGLGLHQIALYDTRLAFRRADGGAWFELQLRQVGYRRVRDNPVPG